MAMTGAVLGMPVVVAVVTRMVMMGGRFRHEPPVARAVLHLYLAAVTMPS